MLTALASGRTYNRFEAERELHDHCLHTTVANLQAKGVTIHRRIERVPGYMGIPTECCRYWLAPESLQKASELLNGRKPLPHSRTRLRLVYEQPDGTPDREERAGDHSNQPFVVRGQALVKAKKRFREHAQKREAGGFVALPHAVLRSPEYARLSPFAVKLLNDLLAQYRGDNNGDLCAPWTLMGTERCWHSKDSLGKALAELRGTRFIVLTRQGGRHVANLYAVTFYEIDFCGGKLDIEAPSRRFMGWWHRDFPKVTPLQPQVMATTLPRRSGQWSKN